MPNNYSALISNVRQRIDPDNIIIEKSINEELSKISYTDVLKYVRYAMKGVEPEYTRKSKEAGENVKTHLINGGISDVNYQYQGSVMTNTHIKGHSDIDLLLISSKSYRYDSEAIKQILNEFSRQQNFQQYQIDKIVKENNVSSYSGNSLQDLKDLRIDSEVIMKKTYLNCDISKAKSIKIKNTNLNREVDIVVANWYDDITSIISDKGSNRGIQVYNKELNQRGKIDFPFISIERINTRSSETQGRLKKMIRFLKNLKAKSPLQIDLSSFDFNAICYDISINEYKYLPFYGLVPIIYNQLKNIANYQIISDSLTSVDGREFIFKDNPEKIQSLRNLIIEVETILSDLKSTFIL